MSVIASTLRELRARKLDLDKAIASLERLGNTHASLCVIQEHGGRGRKPGKMTPEERQQVSIRMSKYWRSRRGGLLMGKCPLLTLLIGPQQPINKVFRR